MNRFLARVIWLFAYFTVALSLRAAGPGSANDFGGRRVLLVGIDGLRADVLEKSPPPRLKRLLRNGVVTFRAHAGGTLGGPDQQPTISGPGWASILTGKYLPDHGVAANGRNPHGEKNGYQPEKAPHFATLIRSRYPGAAIASVSSWDWIEDYFIATQREHFTFHAKGEGKDYAERDRSTFEKARGVLAASDPDVLFVHFDQVDGAGHAGGFSGANPDYLKALESVDVLVGGLLDTIEARPAVAAENWMVLVVSDHGGIGKSHGGQTQEERLVPMIAHGKSLARGRVVDREVGLNAVVPTVLEFLGVECEEKWGLAGAPFGLPPYLDARPAGKEVRLRWTKPDRFAVVEGIEVWRDGKFVTRLPADAGMWVDGSPPDRERLGYEVRFLGPNCRRFAETSVPRAPDVKSGLVLDLPFEGDLRDRSGKGNHAEGRAPVFSSAGRIGQALELRGSSHAILPASEDLRFGGDTDFTIAFWIKAERKWNKDPAILSNKNWSDGSSPGWIIAGGNDLPSWQWNMTDAGRNRRDFDPAPPDANIVDGKWHLVVVTHQRDNRATFYHDGRAIGHVQIRGLGSVDTGYSIHVGQDGTGGFSPDAPILIDGLRIWRRALRAADVGLLVTSE